MRKILKIKNLNKKIFQVSLNKLLTISDVISLHIHADQNNVNFINKKIKFNEKGCIDCKYFKRRNYT